MLRDKQGVAKTSIVYQGERNITITAQPAVDPAMSLIPRAAAQCEYPGIDS